MLSSPSDITLKSNVVSACLTEICRPIAFCVTESFCTAWSECLCDLVIERLDKVAHLTLRRHVDIFTLNTAVNKMFSLLFTTQHMHDLLYYTHEPRIVSHVEWITSYDVSG